VLVGFYTHIPAYEDGTECSETSAYKIQTPGNHPKESIRQLGSYFRQPISFVNTFSASVVLVYCKCRYT